MMKAAGKNSEHVTRTITRADLAEAV